MFRVIVLLLIAGFDEGSKAAMIFGLVGEDRVNGDGFFSGQQGRDFGPSINANSP